jgi:hypothetical protein
MAGGDESLSVPVPNFPPQLRPLTTEDRPSQECRSSVGRSSISAETSSRQGSLDIIEVHHVDESDADVQNGQSP